MSSVASIAPDLARRAYEVLGTSEVTDLVLATQMMKIAEGDITDLRIKQSHVLLYLVDNGLLPDQKSVNAFLRSLGIFGGACWQVGYLASTIRFCRRHGITQPDWYGYGMLNKFIEAVPALRLAIRAGNPAAVKRILRFVERAECRTTVRKRFQKQSAPVATGCTIELPGGQFVLVARILEERPAERMLDRLAGLVEFGMTSGEAKILLGHAMEVLQ